MLTINVSNTLLKKYKSAIVDHIKKSRLNILLDGFSTITKNEEVLCYFKVIGILEICQEAIVGTIEKSY
jgi:hypothetical protein